MLPFGSIPTRSPFPGVVTRLLPVRARVMLPYDIVTLINFGGCTPVIVAPVSHRCRVLSIRRDKMIARDMCPAARYHVLRIATRVVRVTSDALIRVAQMPVAARPPVVATRIPMRCNVVVAADVDRVVGVD